MAFQAADGAELGGVVLHLSRHIAAFRLVPPEAALRVSEVLCGFKIFSGDEPIYFGRAVVSGVVHAGTALHVEVQLVAAEAESSAFQPAPGFARALSAGYDQFFLDWQKEYVVEPEFKLLVVDIAAYLDGVRQWLEEVQFGIRSDGADSEEQGRGIILGAAPAILETFNRHHARFEELAYRIPPGRRGSHGELVRRHWHSLFLCSPFGHRTFHKPLGYAGDYEMMNMIHRFQPEGRSLYAKLVHYLLVSQWPAVSVRNRIAHLKDRLVSETARVVRAGRRARILNVGCGPARELQDFFAESALSHEADCTLLDFNQETLDHAGSRLEEMRRKHSRRAGIQTANLSVQQLLRRAVRQGRLEFGGDFDLIYCGGLFDYLSDNTCVELVNLFYQNLRPGGLVVAANMLDSRPFRNFIEFVLGWHLIYRGAADVRAFARDHAPGLASVLAEPEAVNLFLHLRRPE